MFHICLGDSHAVAQTSVVLEQGRCFGHLDVQEEKSLILGLGSGGKKKDKGTRLLLAYSGDSFNFILQSLHTCSNCSGGSQTPSICQLK